MSGRTLARAAGLVLVAWGAGGCPGPGSKPEDPPAPAPAPAPLAARGPAAQDAASSVPDPRAPVPGDLPGEREKTASVSGDLAGEHAPPPELRAAPRDTRRRMPAREEPAAGIDSEEKVAGGTGARTAGKAEPLPGPGGREIFEKKCKTCHGADGKARTKMGEKYEIPDMSAPSWDEKWPLAKVIDIVTRGKRDTKMKPFAGKLSPAEIEAVAAFVREL